MHMNLDLSVTSFGLHYRTQTEKLIKVNCMDCTLIKPFSLIQLWFHSCRVCTESTKWRKLSEEFFKHSKSMLSKYSKLRYWDFIFSHDRWSHIYFWLAIDSELNHYYCCIFLTIFILKLNSWKILQYEPLWIWSYFSDNGQMMTTKKNIPRRLHISASTALENIF